MAKYRLITRNDFDGVVCGALFKYLNVVDEIVFTESHEIKSGKIITNSNDIITNLPYISGVYLAFDYHIADANFQVQHNHVYEKDSHSTASIIYNYFGAEKKYPKKFKNMVEIVNKINSKDFTKNEILKPKDWLLLNFIVDSRTNLDKVDGFKLSHKEFLNELVNDCINLDIAEILNQEHVKQRVLTYNKYEDPYEDQLHKCTSIYDNLILLDYRKEKVIYPGNRFFLYLLYPKNNIFMTLNNSSDKKSIDIIIEKSTINNTSNVNIDEVLKEVQDLLLETISYGHVNVSKSNIEEFLEKVIKIINKDKLSINAT